MEEHTALPRLQPGMTVEKHIMVERAHTASHLGSGTVSVYATPSMILHMEEAALSLVDPLLPEGMGTVGVSICVKHLAATPVGMEVRIRATLTAVEGRMFTFDLEARDEKDKIGEGSHVRAVVDLARFASKLAAKAGS